MVFRWLLCLQTSFIQEEKRKEPFLLQLSHLSGSTSIRNLSLKCHCPDLWLLARPGCEGEREVGVPSLDSRGWRGREKTVSEHAEWASLQRLPHYHLLIGWPYVPFCQGQPWFTPVVPVLLLLVPPSTLKSVLVWMTNSICSPYLMSTCYLL